MRKRILLIACLFVCACSSAQQYPFVQYTPKEGLVNARVRQMYQDSKGKLYFMTFGGLSVYDGARFRNYTADDGLASDMVNDVLEAGDDSILIACNTVSMNYLRHGRLQKFETADGFVPTINKFFKCRDGTTYFLADEGLFLLKDKKFQRLPMINSQGNEVGSFVVDAIEWNDLLLLLTDHVLSRAKEANFYLFDKNTQSVVAEDRSDYTVNFSKIFDDQLLIIKTNEILMLIDTIALKRHQIAFLPPPAIFADLAGQYGGIYYPGGKYCWLFLQGTKILRVDSLGRRKEYSTANGLYSNNFTSIFHDREGSVWFTMLGAGVFKLVNDNIELYRQFNGVNISNVYGNPALDEAYVYAREENIVVAAGEGRKTVYQYLGPHVRPNTVLVSHGKIMASDGKNLYVVGTVGKTTPSKPALIYRDTVSPGFGYMYEDPFGNILLCGSVYLTVLDAHQPGYPVICHYPVKSFTDQVAFDSQGRVWGASRAGELFVLSINPGAGKNYLQLIKRIEKNYPSPSARTIIVDKTDRVWIGTRHLGIYSLTTDNGLNITSIKQHTIKEGISENYIIHLSCDNENNVWASTASGVDRIRLDGDKVVIEKVTRSNNIYEFVVRANISKSGVAWCYTHDNKLIKISRSKIVSSYIPNLSVASVKIGNDIFDKDSLPSNLSYRQNNISLSVAPHSYYDEHQVQYSYLLEGSGNDQWSEPSNNASFNFVNLVPGNYKLRVRAAFPGGRYPEQEIHYSFLIHPPWWQTWWFKWGAALLGIGLLALFIRNYYRRKLATQKIYLEKQQAIEKERTRIATDIHDDLGSGLSRIRYLGETVKFKSTQKQDIMTDIEKISVFSDEMVDKMNEIVWALNEKNDSLQSIVAYIRAFAAEYFSNNNIPCTIQVPESIPSVIMKGETRRNIFLSVKECIHNIVKHAGATDADLTMFVSDQLVIQIHDNGRGIDWDNLRPFSNGLSNIKKRMSEAKGSVEFINDKGTTVILRIPLV